MYQSRLHATNGIISVAVDALNGEILEFTRESTWDNVVKNHVRPAYSLFEGMIWRAQERVMFHVPRYRDILADESLKPVITVEQGEDSATVTLEYPYLMTGNGKLDVSAKVTIELPAGQTRTTWRVTLDNRTDDEIDEVAFPNLSGMWLGDTWEDDVLVLPRFAGLKVYNPVQKLAMEPKVINWKWQEYLYEYNLGERTGSKDSRGAYVADLAYTGSASMLWMDLYDEKEGTGIYMTCRNNDLVMKGVRAYSFGENYPGLGLAIVHKPSICRGEWKSEECVVAIHDGDWHWAADDYRSWRESIHRPVVGHHRPEWFEKSAGLVAHYDFQYQLGGIVHRFADIPKLYQQAKEMGMNHLLLSGWNEDGFDFGFPHYTPNHLLGTEQELKDALAQVKADGGHVAFYINTRLCNAGFADEADFMEKSVVRKRDGTPYIEHYGAGVPFGSLCINVAPWRQRLVDTVNYLTHEIGADGMYLDQLAMAGSLKCYNPAHDHGEDRTAWNQGYEKLLDTLRADYDPKGMALIYEGCNDIYGPGASGQLITTLGGPLIGRFPEMYKYTFPDQILVDMMNPRRNSAMRPEHVARRSTEFLHHAFVIGAYLWCYDLEWDNTWRRDPEQYLRLQKIVALRKAWLEHYGQGRFTDTVGILSAPEDAMIKRFAVDGGVLLACAREGGLTGEVVLPNNGETEAYVLTYDAPEPKKADILRVEKDRLIISLPESEMAVIVIK